MKTIRRFMAPLAVLLIASPLLAQDTGFSVQAGLLNGFQSLEKVTGGKKTGIALGVSYEKNIYKTDNEFRLSILMSSFSCAEKNNIGLTMDKLTNFQLSGDVFLPTKIENLRYFVGLSANGYSAIYGRIPDNGDDANPADPFIYDVNLSKGTKMGIRTGLDYRINEKWSADVTFQLTELGTSYVNKGGGLNPAWLQFTARYHF